MASGCKAAEDGNVVDIAKRLGSVVVGVGKLGVLITEMSHLQYMMAEDFATLELDMMGQLAVDMDLNKLAEAAVGHELYSKFVKICIKLFNLH